MVSVEGAPARSTFHSIGGVMLHVVEAGIGPAVVLLHPEPGDASTFAAVLPQLSNEYRVLAPDLRGHGKSAKPRGDYSVPTQAAYVARLLDATAVDRAVLVGNSYGAIVALQIAADAPERVRALVLSGTCAYRAYRLPWKARLLSSWAGRLFAPLVPGRVIEHEYRAQFADPIAVSPEQIAAVRAAFADRTGRRCLWQQAHQLDFGNVENLLQRISVPVLLLWGRNDTATPLIWAHRLEQDLAGARLEIIEECGHYPPLEQPDTFARIASEFVADLPS